MQATKAMTVLKISSRKDQSSARSRICPVKLLQRSANYHTSKTIIHLPLELDLSLRIPDSIQAACKTMRSKSNVSPAAFQSHGLLILDSLNQAARNLRMRCLQLRPRPRESSKVFNSVSVIKNPKSSTDQTKDFFPNNDINPGRKLRIQKAIEHGATWSRHLTNATHVVVDRSMTYNQLLAFLKLSHLPVSLLQVEWWAQPN